MAGFPDDIDGGLGLSSGAVVDGLGLEVILKTTETPIAEVVFVEVLASWAKLLDDDFVRKAVIDHAVDLLAEGEGQASDFAVAAGPGLAGLELASEIVFGGVGEEGVHWISGVID
jgi:hypothetical protein